MVTLPVAQVLFAERGINISIRSLQRWAAAGKFEAVYGKRDGRYLMRRRAILALLHPHGGRA